MHILLTNDDGLMAPGLLAIYEGFKKRGHIVTACAPNGQRSAQARAVTLRKPVNVAPQVMPDGGLGFSINGTPADCVRLGFTALAKDPIDLVVSGINDDFNLGYDINYSGTVAAALEAAAAGFPSLAASTQRAESYDWKNIVHIVLAVADNFVSWSIPHGVAVNLNIPAKLTSGRNDWYWTKPHQAPVDDYYESQPLPDGSVNYLRLRGSDRDPACPETDAVQAELGHITLSPVISHSFHEGVLKRLIADNPA